MSEKVKIKVIKKKELKIAESNPVVVVPSKQQSAREMVSTVSNWVSDLQNRKRKETKVAIETFFSNHPQPSGA